ncbi:ribonuclease HII [Paenibacillus yanchengensis]|uniref:Ribonuclease HII n=1 Tax=Paenibacillus yanchengensis TaxID=2035833 RepID=A0ABW4YMZ2_9BACL
MMLLQYEKELYEQGFSMIAGVDEVGRGCLFGDVVAAAVILPAGYILEDINDSKKLSERKREQLYEQITADCIAWSVSRKNAQIVDTVNIKQASKLAMQQAIAELSTTPDYVLIDAEQLILPIPSLSLIKGDALSQSIAAASIIAKVTRDQLCKTEWETNYPGYGIATHKGYATKMHQQKLRELGATAEHRQTFLTKIL